jgi:hypothetical protein
MTSGASERAPKRVTDSKSEQIPTQKNDLFKFSALGPCFHLHRPRVFDAPARRPTRIDKCRPCDIGNLSLLIRSIIGVLRAQHGRFSELAARRIGATICDC